RARAGRGVHVRADAAGPRARSAVRAARHGLSPRSVLMLAAVAPLMLAVLAGVLFGALGLFRAPDQAIATLNRLCLYLAFPALIFANVYAADLRLAAAPGF